MNLLLLPILAAPKNQAESALREFEAHMRGLPEVREVHMLNGEIDFILKVVSRDLQSFQEFLIGKLTPGPNVKKRQDKPSDPHEQERAGGAVG